VLKEQNKGGRLGLTDKTAEGGAPHFRPLEGCTNGRQDAKNRRKGKMAHYKLTQEFQMQERCGEVGDVHASPAIGRKKVPADRGARKV